MVRVVAARVASKKRPRRTLGIEMSGHATFARGSGARREHLELRALPRYVVLDRQGIYLLSGMHKTFFSTRPSLGLRRHRLVGLREPSCLPGRTRPSTPGLGDHRMPTYRDSEPRARQPSSIAVCFRLPYLASSWYEHADGFAVGKLRATAASTSISTVLENASPASTQSWRWAAVIRPSEKSSGGRARDPGISVLEVRKLSPPSPQYSSYSCTFECLPEWVSSSSSQSLAGRARRSPRYLLPLLMETNKRSHSDETGRRKKRRGRSASWT